MNASQSALGGNHDGFIAKLNSGGTALIYSTYMGGGADDYVIGLAGSASGAAYLAGTTGSIDFPAVNALQTSYGLGSSDAFVAKVMDAWPTPCEAIDSIMSLVAEADFPTGLRNSLVAKLAAACRSFDRGNATADVNQLGAFQNEVRAKSGKSIPGGVANALIAAAQAIIDNLP